ncbi:hypothetical protein B7463_g4646, partial [Scytalidium lignicola]
MSESRKRRSKAGWCSFGFLPIIAKHLGLQAAKPAGDEKSVAMSTGQYVQHAVDSTCHVHIAFCPNTGSEPAIAASREVAAGSSNLITNLGPLDSARVLPVLPEGEKRWWLSKRGADGCLDIQSFQFDTDFLNNIDDIFEMDSRTGLSPPRTVGISGDVGPIITQDNLESSGGRLSPTTSSWPSNYDVAHHTPIQSIKRPVTLGLLDQEPLQHFITTMVRFCVLRNCEHDNLYIYILTTMGLYHESLFCAMMAWSSLHLAHLRKRSPRDAESRYEKAIRLLQQDLTEEFNIDLLLTTIWFLLQYQLLLANGVDKFQQLLSCSADIIKAEIDRRQTSETALNRIGPIGSIVLVWMSARDSQASHFGSARRLLGYLKMYPDIYDLVDKSDVLKDPSVSANWPSGSSLQDVETLQLQLCMRLSLRIQIVHGQIILLGRWKPTITDSTSWTSVLVNLEILKREVEEDDSPTAIAALAVAKGSLCSMPSISALGYNRLLLLSSYYGTLITYHTHNPKNLSTSGEMMIEAAECAARIIRIQQRVTHARPNSPQAFWPTTLFHAATVTKDPVYQSWVVRTFALAERWGGNLVKSRILLEHILDRQNRSGTRVDFLEVMKETTGYFVV